MHRGDRQKSRCVIFSERNGKRTYGKGIRFHEKRGGALCGIAVGAPVILHRAAGSGVWGIHRRADIGDSVLSHVRHGRTAEDRGILNGLPGGFWGK